MIRAAWAFAVLALAGAAALRPADEPAGRWTVLVGGDSRGYLTPCGCVKPMSGGIRRRATAYRVLADDEQTLTLENAALVAGDGRQDELKAETLAEAMREMRVDAVNLGLADARLGPGTVGTLARLARERVVATGLSASEAVPLPRWIERGPFLVGGASDRADELAAALGAEPATAATAARDLVGEAVRRELVPVLLLDGGREAAERLARAQPALRLIVHRGDAAPAEAAARVGETWIVSPGPQGKRFLRLTWEDGRFEGYRVVDLGPEWDDDPGVARLYQAYQRRVREEALLDRLPRREAPGYAGSQACRSCHSADYDTWAESEHAAALKTLEDDGQDRDPDCTGCHVVGLEDATGFRSRQLTPELTDVGCESCHGPSAAHVARPEVRTPGDPVRACMACHTPDHSPGFDYETYWKRIAHGPNAPKPSDPASPAPGTAGGKPVERTGEIRGNEKTPAPRQTRDFGRIKP